MTHNNRLPYGRDRTQPIGTIRGDQAHAIKQVRIGKRLARLLITKQRVG